MDEGGAYEARKLSDALYYLDLRSLHFVDCALNMLSLLSHSIRLSFLLALPSIEVTSSSHVFTFL